MHVNQQILEDNILIQSYIFILQGIKKVADKSRIFFKKMTICNLGLLTKNIFQQKYMVINYFFFILECLFSFKLTANTRRYNKGSNKPLCKICKLHVAFSLTILLTSSTECTYLFSKTFILPRPDLWHSFSVFITRCIAIQVD